MLPPPNPPPDPSFLYPRGGRSGGPLFDRECLMRKTTPMSPRTRRMEATMKIVRFPLDSSSFLNARLVLRMHWPGGKKVTVIQHIYSCLINETIIKCLHDIKNPNVTVPFLKLEYLIHHCLRRSLKAL